MYEALREMVVEAPEGGFVRVQPGEEVKGFHSWPLANQLAAVKTQMVRERPTGTAPAAAHQREAFEQLNPLVSASRGNVPAQPGVFVAPPAGGERPPVVVSPEPISGAQIVAERIEEPVAEAEADNHLCGECDFRAASSQGLKLHITRKHLL